MSHDPGIGGGASAPWYRVVAIPDTYFGGSPERDYAAVLPAVLGAAQARRPFVTGWISRGGGAPLELVTNAGPFPAAPSQQPRGGRSAGGAPWSSDQQPSPGRQVPSSAEPQ